MNSILSYFTISNYLYNNNEDEKTNKLGDKLYSIIPNVVLNLFGYNYKTYDLCIYCKQDKPNIVIFNCKHKYICKKCLELNNIRKCKICEQSITYFAYIENNCEIYSYIL